jgi:hypothetical protein
MQLLFTLLISILIFDCENLFYLINGLFKCMLFLLVKLLFFHKLSMVVCMVSLKAFKVNLKILNNFFLFFIPFLFVLLFPILIILIELAKDFPLIQISFVTIFIKDQLSAHNFICFSK